jgi:hypothetical protein
MIGHWLWKRAVDSPTQLQVWTYEENNQTFIKVALYLSETKTIWTNLAGCPWMHHHHVGSTCEICGMKD